VTYTLDWSETDLGGTAVTSYGSGAILDFTDKPSGATSALSITSNQADGVDNILAEFSIVTTGSSVMTFDYKVSTESGWDKFHIDVDGVSQANYSGIVAWTSHAGINIASAGTHTIRFRYTKDSGGAGNADRVWVALLNITNTSTTNDASGSADTYDMEDGAIPSFVTTSTWTNSTSEPIAGSRSLRSPASPANSGTYDLEIEKAAGDDWAAVGFDFKVSTEAGWDKLFLFPDATASNIPATGSPSTSGESGWLDWSGSTSGRLAVILPAAASSLLLRYTKDGGGSGGSDAVWIDNLDMPAAGGATNYNGTVTAASTATTSSTGVVGKVATAALAATVAVAAVGVVGKSAGSTIAETATTTAAGSVTSGTSATSTVASTGSVTTAGVVGRSSGSTLSGTATTAAAGVVGKVATSSLASTATVTAAGTVVSGISSSATITSTANTTTAGVVGRVATTALSSTATIAAAGLVEVPGSGTAALATTGNITASGLVAATSLASITAAAEMLAAGAVGGTRTTTLAATATVTAAGTVVDPGAIAPTPAERTVVVPAEDRVVIVPAENRTVVVPADPRTLEA
jgi:hypothetical protein